MGNLVGKTLNSDDGIVVYNNIVNSLNGLDDTKDTLIKTLKKLRDESYEKEKEFFKNFIPQEQQKTFFNSFFSEMNDISTYINFLKSQDISFFKSLLIGRELKKQEENFIDFLYSKEVIAGLNPDTQLRFEMSEVEGKKTIGSGHEITIKDFLEYIWRELKTKATEKWMEEHEKNNPIPPEKLSELSRFIMQDLAGLEFFRSTTSKSGKSGYSARSKEKVKFEELLAEYSFTIEENIQQKTLIARQDIINQEDNKKIITSKAHLVQIGEKTLNDLEEVIQQLSKKALENEGIEVEDGRIKEHMYTGIFIDKKEFNKIKFERSTCFLNSFSNNNNNNNNFYKNFSSFLETQLEKASSHFLDAKQYWKEVISKNSNLINQINNWGQSYNSGAAVIGHIGENFASFYLGLNKTTVYGQNLNKLKQQAHVDVAYNNDTGFQIKNYSSVVNSFHLYDTDISVFRKDITRYIGPINNLNSDEIIIQLRYLSAYQFLFKNTDKMKKAVKKVLEMNFEYWSRYGDFQSNLGDLKNNFFVLNFKLIPASLIFQKIICELRKNKNNNKYFDLSDFPLSAPSKGEYRHILDPSKSDLSNLESDKGGRVIYNGFTFDLKEINSISYQN